MKFKNQFYLVLVLLIGFACNSKKTEETAANDSVSTLDNVPVNTDNTLTESEKVENWKLLFDGTSTKGWRKFKASDTTDTGWIVENGTLTTPGGKGDIITVDPYENYELVFEWKIEPKGNSGVIYNVQEGNHTATYETGPEYQLVDDVNYPSPLTESNIPEQITTFMLLLIQWLNRQGSLIPQNWW